LTTSEKIQKNLTLNPSFFQEQPPPCPRALIFLLPLSHSRSPSFPKEGEQNASPFSRSLTLDNPNNSRHPHQVSTSLFQP